MLASGQRSRVRALVEGLRFLREEEALHYHTSGGYQPLHPDLHKSHERAKDATHLADHIARNWPEPQRRYLHGKAAEEHNKTARTLHQAGFQHLAQQHLQWAHYHAAHATQAQQPSGLHHHAPQGGHARSGHTLPHQPSSAQHAGDVPTAAPSHHKAGQTGSSWNNQSHEYQQVPPSVKKNQRRANLVTKSVNKMSYDPNFSDQERAHHHRAAASNHVAVAQDFMRHGFHKQADRHMRLAQGHTDQAGRHDAPSARALLPAKEK